MFSFPLISREVAPRDPEDFFYFAIMSAASHQLSERSYDEA
ncbi:MAG: hypothetical protein Q8P36_02925 [bacterium]|nr:hypothetical protein [bacterium]